MGYDHELTVWNKFDYQYFASFQFGTQHQTMKLLLDTGSSWTWVPSSDCPDSQCPNRHYNYHHSLKFHNTTVISEVFYGVGSIEGHIVSDVVSLGTEG